MTGSDSIDDTAADYDRLETELIAQDRDAARVVTADVDETAAHQLVDDLVEDDVVTPVADQRVLVHEPSGEAFNSITQLAVFHRGWRAAADVDAEGDECSRHSPDVPSAMRRLVQRWARCTRGGKTNG